MQTSIKFSKNGVTASLKLEVEHTALHRAFVHHAATTEQAASAIDAYSGHLESDATQQLTFLQSLTHVTLMGLELSLFEQIHPETISTNDQVDSSTTCDTHPLSFTSQAPTPPAIGKYWEGQGGIYAGIIRDGEHQWHLILAVTPESKLNAPWGQYPNEIPGENCGKPFRLFSDVDGHFNCTLISKAEPNNKIIAHIANLEIDGKKDFYFPAKKENNLLYINLPEHLDKKWHWSSTQYSARNAWDQYFGDGSQTIDFKDLELAVRAVRRLPI